MDGVTAFCVSQAFAHVKWSGKWPAGAVADVLGIDKGPRGDMLLVYENLGAAVDEVPELALHELDALRGTMDALHAAGVMLNLDRLPPVDWLVRTPAGSFVFGPLHLLLPPDSAAHAEYAALDVRTFNVVFGGGADVEVVDEDAAIDKPATE